MYYPWDDELDIRCIHYDAEIERMYQHNLEDLDPEMEEEAMTEDAIDAYNMEGGY